MRTTTEFFEDAVLAADEINNAVADDQYSKIARARAAGKEAVTAYNKQARNECFESLLKSEKPFYSAILQETYEGIKLEKKDKSSAKIDVAVKVIDLVELEDYARKTLSSNGQWRHQVEKFCQIMTKPVVADVENKKETERFNAEYKITETANSVTDLDPVPVIDKKGKATLPDPTSLTQKTAMLQKLIDGILFEDNGNGLNKYKVTSKDVKYIDRVFCQHGKARRSISTANVKTMRGYLLEVIHSIAVGCGYSVEFDTKKSDEKKDVVPTDKAA